MKSTHKTATHVIAGVLAMGALGVANAAIINTRHNLGTSSSAGFNQTGGTGEICVFCHTPHAANTTAKAPLWNKGLPSSTYTLYASSTMDNAAGITVGPGGISLACLSCHDGSQAMDNVVNAPGSGGYTSGGARMSGTWSGARVGAGTGLMTNAGTFISMLGTDLSNDHPIGIPYCGNAPSGAVTMSACTDPDFFTYAINANGTSGGYVNRSGSAAGKDKTDMYLYANSGGGTLMVECASCHDPHSGNATFLRVSNSASTVCLTCHNK